jgi:alkylation response protein AidB-like acyl-CoA dehydrogenase
MSVAAAFREFIDKESSGFALPGSGRTWSRFEALSSAAADDLSVGRLVEGHMDALAILAEAAMPAVPDARYGVWAARSRTRGTTAVPVTGGWRLTGEKPFCSGSGILDRALVTAATPDGDRLFDIDLADHVMAADPSSWPAVGMADSASETLHFGGPVIKDCQAVGGAGFYTGRPGFWFGAVGVAACWYGGAVGLVDHLVASLDTEPGEHVLADLGRAASKVTAMGDVLRQAARGIDGDPFDAEGGARARALSVRQIVHDLSVEVLAATGSAGGARPLCHDRDQARRAADLYVYLAQHHGGADAAELGRLTLGHRP